MIICGGVFKSFLIKYFTDLVHHVLFIHFDRYYHILRKFCKKKTKLNKTYVYFMQLEMTSTSLMTKFYTTF